MIPAVNYAHDSIYSWLQKYRCAPNKSMQNVKERHINSMDSFFWEFYLGFGEMIGISFRSEIGAAS